MAAPAESHFPRPYQHLISPSPPPSPSSIIIAIILPTAQWKWYFTALICFPLIISEMEHLFSVRVILLLSTDCSCPLPIFLLLLCGGLIWRSFYYRIFVIGMRGSVSIPDTSPLSVVCIANITLNISKLKTFSSEVPSTRDRRDCYQPRKGY